MSIEQQYVTDMGRMVEMLSSAIRTVGELRDSVTSLEGDYASLEEAYDKLFASSQQLQHDLDVAKEMQVQGNV